MRQSLSIIIPVHNNEGTLLKISNQITETLSKNEYISTTTIVLIDDGSSDNSWQKLIEIKDIYKDKVKIVKLKKNYGQRIALIAGLLKSKSDLYITMDADLDDKPEDINVFIEKYKSDQSVDLILGHRLNYNENSLKAIGSKAFNLAFNFFSKKKLKRSSNFRLLTDQHKQKLLKTNHNDLELTLTSLEMKSKIEYVEVSYTQNQSSSYTIYQRIKLFLKNIIKYSNFNLAFIIFTFSMYLLFFLIIMMYNLYNYFIFGVTVPGYFTIIFLITISFIFNFAILALILYTLLSLKKTLTTTEIFEIDSER